MKRSKLFPLGLVCALMAITPSIGSADVTFTFLEVGSNVEMTSSGTLETANLIPGTFHGWGGTGVGNFSPVAMAGGTEAGVVDTAFAFHAGTDYSEWAVGLPWTQDTFGWSFIGSKGFATYDNSSGFQPGIHLSSSDMVGTTWTPDQAWTIAGSFASLGFNPGTYTVSDIVTGESITYQIGPIGTKYCNQGDGHPNNTSGIDISGNTLSQGPINVCMTGGPTGELGYLLIGAGNQIVNQPPGAMGDLCIVGGFISRYAKDIAQVDSTGMICTDISNSISGGANYGIPNGGGNIAPGDTWYFQYWHRQPSGQPSTFSEAACVTFKQ